MSASHLSRDVFDQFSELIVKELGIKMPKSKTVMLQSRLLRRMRELEIDSFDEYGRILFDSANSAEEFVHFADAVTTNKTEFFRESAHFDYLTKEALSELDARPTMPWNFNLLCAGCSSGEEAYTLAMVLSEYARQRKRFFVSIMGTDISTQMLNTARLGIYDEDRIEPIPMNLRSRYLLKSIDRSKRLTRIRPELRNLLEFHRLNFMDADYRLHRSFDVIFFRNVLIYFDPPTQEQVVRKLCRSLRPGGYFFISHSESLAGLDVPLKMKGAAVFRKIDKSNAGNVVFGGNN